MNFKVKVKCTVSDAIFEVSPIRNDLASAFLTEGNRIKERYEEIYSYLTEHGLEDHELLSYEHILMLFKGYVHKALLNEAVVRVLDVERSQYNILDTLEECITERKIRDYAYGEPMIRAFAHAIRSLPNGDCMEAVSHGSTILLLEKKFLNERYI